MYNSEYLFQDGPAVWSGLWEVHRRVRRSGGHSRVVWRCTDKPNFPWALPLRASQGKCLNFQQSSWFCLLLNCQSLSEWFCLFRIQQILWSWDNKSQQVPRGPGMPHGCSGKSLLWSHSFSFRLFSMRRSSGEKSVTPLRTSMVSGKWCPIDGRRLSALQALRLHESHDTTYILCSLTNPSLFHSNHTLSFSEMSYSKAMLSQHNYQNRFTAHATFFLSFVSL